MRGGTILPVITSRRPNALPAPDRLERLSRILALVDGIVSDARELKDDLSIGLFFSITCNEDMPFVREADVAAAVRGTYLGDYRLRQQQTACSLWPRAVLPKGYRNPVHSSVPTLFVTGDQDGGTPLWFTPRVAKNFSHRAIVVVRGQGHTEWNGCVAGKI